MGDELPASMAPQTKRIKARFENHQNDSSGCINQLWLSSKPKIQIRLFSLNGRPHCFSVLILINPLHKMFLLHHHRSQAIELTLTISSFLTLSLLTADCGNHIWKLFGSLRHQFYNLTIDLSTPQIHDVVSVSITYELFSG